jgi:hypothetical protein
LLFVLVGFTALALLLTWPAAARLASHVPGDGIDDPSLAWNLWWAKHALVDQPQNPFDVRWQFWPIGVNLAFYTLTLLNGALSIPLQVVFGPIVAYNLLLLSSFVLSGLGAYLLSLDVQRRVSGGAADPNTMRLAAFLGGALYAFAAPRLFYAALGQGNIASAQWIPFATLYIMRTVLPGGRARDATLAAVFVILQAYAELTYATFLALFAVLAFVWGAWPALRDHKGRLGPLIGRTALIAALTVIGLTPMLANMLPDLRAESGLLTSGGGFADLFSADLAGYLIPTQLHPVLGDVIRSIANDSAPRPDGSHMPVNKGQHIYVGYVAVALILMALARRGRPRQANASATSSGANESVFWLVAAAVFFLLTLGPSLRVLGHDLGIPLPFVLVAQLPFFEGNRYPSRYSVMLLMSLSPLLALGASKVVPRFHAPGSASSTSRFTFLVLLAALLFEHLSTPLPTFDLRAPALYQRVAAEPGDFALMEMPPGWRNGARVAGKKDIVIMQQLWNQSAHGKRLLGGNTSRNPELKFQYYGEDPFLARLIAQTNAADTAQHDALRAALAAPITEAERAHARTLAAFLDLRYVMVHRDKISAETEAALLDLLPLDLVAEEGSLALYRLAGDLPDPNAFRVGGDDGRMALAEGWSPPVPGNAATGPDATTAAPVYAQRQEARLLLPLPQETTRIQLHIGALAPDQAVTLIVDGQPVGTQPLPDAPGWLTFDAPADANRPPLSDVRLRFATIQPVSVLASTLSRAGPAGLLVRSAGEETGDFGHIYVNGVEMSPNTRGYNLVALDPDTGQLLARAAFDTHADPAAGTALAAWVGGLPAGTLVAGAVRDEASIKLDDSAIAALRSLGVAADLRGRFRWGHAFIGAKGAEPGSAQESVDGVRPAQVSRGLPLSEPQVAAQLFEVKVERP